MRGREGDVREGEQKESKTRNSKYCGTHWNNKPEIQGQVETRANCQRRRDWAESDRTQEVVKHVIAV